MEKLKKEKVKEEDKNIIYLDKSGYGHQSG